MSTTGIYGLSGSGIDVDSMVKVGMMTKQNQYDKMYKEEIKNEWMKSAYADLYSEVNTFNQSTLSNYKMSSTTSPMTATSTSEGVATATANADAASMSHTVTVSKKRRLAFLRFTLWAMHSKPPKSSVWRITPRSELSGLSTRTRCSGA